MKTFIKILSFIFVFCFVIQLLPGGYRVEAAKAASEPVVTGSTGGGTDTKTLYSAAAGASQVSAGGYFTAVLKTDGTVWMWGKNDFDQCGTGAATDTEALTQVPGLAGVVQITTGTAFTMALKSDGTVWSWGRNWHGELGAGDAYAFSTKVVQVTGLAGVQEISAGSYHGLALKSDGTVWSWGYNEFGQLGNGSNEDSHAPVRVGGLNGISSVAAGAYSSYAVKSDGTAWSWGRNDKGQLGDGTTADKDAPVQVGGLTGVRKISAGFEHALALLTNGGVKAWGSNGDLQLGNASNENSSTPVNVTGLGGPGSAIDISAGAYHSLAVKQDGTAAAWGSGDCGVLGNGAGAWQITPVSVSGLTNIVQIDGGYAHSTALSGDGAVWSWGDNRFGLVPGTDALFPSVPVQSQIDSEEEEPTGQMSGEETPVGTYTDILGHRAQNAIEKWSSLGILQGSGGKFRPEDTITRGEMAVILDRLMHYQSKSPNTFYDLGQKFYTDALLKANAAGIILGSGSFLRPAATLPHEEAAVILGRALGISENAAAGNHFSDSASISSWALGYVNAMAAKGYLHISSGAFAPKGGITRAEVVTILDNALSAVYNEEKIYVGGVSSTVIVNVPGVTIKNALITGDLIISEGVGNGDVTLDNVTVRGNTIVRGGGANSIHIEGNSQITNIVIEKTDSGALRIVTADGAVVNAVFIDDGSDDVILTGSFSSVTIASDVVVNTVGADIGSVSITASGGALNVDANSKITSLTVAEGASGTVLTINGTVETLTTNAQITVTNKGTIKTASVNADDVIIDGNKPSTLNVGSAVTDGPKDKDGNDLDGGVSSSGTSTPIGGGGIIPGIVNAAAPVITKNPQSVTTDVDKIVTLSVTAKVNDGGDISYAWFINATNSNSGGDALGVKTATYQPDVSNPGTFYYYCIVTNTNNAVSGAKQATTTSGVAIVTVKDDSGPINSDLQLTNLALPTHDSPQGEPTNIGKYSFDSLLGAAPIYFTDFHATASLVDVSIPEGAQAGKYIGVLVTTNKDITTLALKTSRMETFDNLNEDDITEAVSVGATGRNTFVWWIDTQGVSCASMLHIKEQGADDSTAVSFSVYFNAYNPLKVIQVNVSNTTNPGSPVPAVGDVLTIDATMNDGQPADGRVTYYAEIFDPNAIDIYYFALTDSASNTFTVPATFEINGQTISTVGMRVSCYVKVSGDLTPSVSVQKFLGPITDAGGPVSSTNIVFFYDLSVTHYPPSAPGANDGYYAFTAVADTDGNMTVAVTPAAYASITAPGIYIVNYDMYHRVDAATLISTSTDYIKYGVGTTRADSGLVGIGAGSYSYSDSAPVYYYNPNTSVLTTMDVNGIMAAANDIAVAILDVENTITSVYILMSDTTAPSFIDTYPKALNVDSNSFDITVKASETVTYYFVTYDHNAPGHLNPSTDQVIAGTDGNGSSDVTFGVMGPYAGDIEATMQFMGMDGFTAYDVFVVAVDSSNNKSEVAILAVQTLADTLAPSFIKGYPQASNIGASSFDIFVMADERVTCYFVEYEHAPGRSDPSVIQVLNGTDGNNNSLNLNTGKLGPFNPGSEGTMHFTSMFSSTTYDVFVVAMDATGNTSGVIKLTVTTAADTTPPSMLAGYPQSSNIGSDVFDVTIMANEHFIKYYIVAYDQSLGRIDPNADQVIAGTDGDNNDTGRWYGSSGWVYGDSEYTFYFDRLAGSTTYDVFIVAVDWEDNKSTVAKIQITTLSSD